MIIGHLPGDGSVPVLGVVLSETQLVKSLGFVIFLAAFVPLIFGGTVYRMLERLMVIKIVIVLSYLAIVSSTMVSGRTASEVASGFLRFGAVPLRADSVVAGRQYTLTERDGEASYTVRGTIEAGRPLVTAFVVKHHDATQTNKMGGDVPKELQPIRDRLVDRGQTLAQRGGFYVEYTFWQSGEGVLLVAEGRIAADRAWQADRFSVTSVIGHAWPSPQAPAHVPITEVREYGRLDDVPESLRPRFRSLLGNQGVDRVNLIGYLREHGRLPDLDWAMLAAFAAIAGAGGLTAVLELCPRQGMGHGSARRRDSQRDRRPPRPPRLST